MAKVTKIGLQKNKKRVNIFLDRKFAFGLDLESFVKINLKVGQHLTKIEIEHITETAQFKNLADRAINFATLRPRSVKEVNLWCSRNKISEDTRSKLFNRLKRLKLLDDKKFAQWWVEQRIQFKSKSKREIVQELKQKGIYKDIIDEAISSLNFDEGRQAKELLEKKAYKWERFEKYIAKQKMSEYLARKGFAWDIIRKTVDSFLKNE